MLHELRLIKIIIWLHAPCLFARIRQNIPLVLKSITKKRIQVCTMIIMPVYDERPDVLRSFTLVGNISVPNNNSLLS